MLAPPGKYKKFVSLVMGFILLAVMVAPLARFSAEIPLTDFFAGIIAPTTQQSDFETSYAAWRNTYLRDAFHAQLLAQLTNLLTQNNFTIHEADISFADDFTALTNVHVTVSQREDTPGRTPFIRIQPVQPVQILRGSEEQDEICPTTEAVKNLISEFYNLSPQHIHVNVR